MAEVLTVGLFVRLTVLVALGIVVLFVAAFLLKALILGALVAALVVAGFIVVNFVRHLGAGDGGPLARR